MNLTKKISAILIGLFLFAAVVDFSAKGLRLAYNATKASKEPKRAGSKASIIRGEYGGSFRPSQPGVLLNNVPVNINSLGCRGPELGGRPRRVVCMGDSVTFGWSASCDDGTYPAFLAKRLALLVDCEDRIAVEHFADVCHLKDSGNELLADCVAKTLREVMAGSGKGR